MSARHAAGLTVGLWAVMMAAPLAGQDPQPAESAVDAPVYELRTYVTVPGRLPALHQRFREHTVKLFEKHGMENVIYWTPADKEDTLVYVLKHKSRDAADKSWTAFRNDPEWKKAQMESERDGKIVEKVERVWLTTTDYSPQK
ncbi:MAG: NIPSNAP family protein [Planctomycetales bacterium]